MFPYSMILLTAAILGGQPIDKKAVFDRNQYLVRAKALSISYHPDGKWECHCIFEIEHVYVGPDSLIGEHFEARQYLPAIAGAGGSMNWTRPEVKKGEASIWWIVDRPTEKKEKSAVKEKAKKPRLVAADNDPKTGNNQMFPPTRRIEHVATDSDDEWKEERVQSYKYIYIEKCSMGLERVYRASKEKRLDIIKELGRRDLQLLQDWCLGSLKSVLSKADYVAYLNDLAAHAPLSLWMETRVDYELSKLSSAWRKSATRVKFFQRWMNGKLSDDKAKAEEEKFLILDALRTGNLYGSYYDGFPYATFLRLMIDGLTSDRRSEDFKKELLGLREFKPKGLAAVDAGFDYLMSQIRKADPDRRLAAAQLLTHFVPLCKPQETAVKKLLDDPAYKPVAAPLADALQKTKVVLDGLSGKDGDKVEVHPFAKWEFLWLKLVEECPEPQAVRFIGEHVRPSLAVEYVDVSTWVAALDSDKFRHREDASRQLAAMGLEAEPILRSALARTGSTEVRRRLGVLLAQFTQEETITLRSIPILAKMDTPEALTVLRKLASGAADARITQEANEFLARGKKKGKKGTGYICDP